MILPVFLLIAFLFFVLLVLKKFAPNLIFCVICTSVSLTWISLLLAYKLGLYENVLIVGMLMGQSTVGLFYLVESKVSEEMKMFRLPFLLTLTFTAYSILMLPQDWPGVIALLTGIWLVFGSIYMYRNTKARKIMDNLVACCKRW